MRQSMKFVLCGLVSLAMVQTVQAAEQHHSMDMDMSGMGASAEQHHDMAMTSSEATPEQQVIHASGVIKEIDLVNKKITIAHDAIPAISWPAMTMRFTFTTQDESINALTVGAAVNFSFIQQGNISLLKTISVIPS